MQGIKELTIKYDGTMKVVNVNIAFFGAWGAIHFSKKIEDLNPNSELIYKEISKRIVEEENKNNAKS